MKTTNKELIEKLESHIVVECRPVDREGLFADMLDECYSFEKVGGPFACMSPSRVLLEMDPVAFRCGVNDYIDGLDISEVSGNDYNDDDIEDAKESFIDELNERLSELESDLAELQGDEDASIQEMAKLERQIADLRRDIEDAEDWEA